MGQNINTAGAVRSGGSISNSKSSVSAGDHLSRTKSRHPANPRGLEYYRKVPAFAVLQHAAEKIPNRDAIRYGAKAWNYKELNRDAIRCAAMLQKMGVKPGDRVGLLLPNVPEYIIAANGIWRAGGVVVAISPLMVADEVKKLLSQTGCRYVIGLDMLSHLVDGFRSDLKKLLLVSIREHLPAYKQLGYFWIRHRRTGHWSMPANVGCGWFWDEMQKTDNRWRPISINPQKDPAYILPTGGTTGSPKAVTLSHENMVANAWQQYVWTDKSFGKETMLAVLPFFHSYGISATVMGGAMMGATLVLHHRFNTRQVIRLIEKHRPTVFHAVPAMLVAINDRLRTNAANLWSLRWVISGGASLDSAVAEEFTEHSGALVVEGFGLSEASPVTHVGNLFTKPRYGAIGLPLPETEVRIVNQDLENGVVDVPDGTVGQMLIRGPQVMLGYWRDPAGTAEAIKDGWLHTGDLAIRHSDGYYSIAGRCKDLIITSGFNVYPSEVEAVLREHEDVVDAAVIGEPDTRRGQIVKAVVVMKNGKVCNESLLIAHCNARLSKHKRPQVFEQCDGDLPRNFLGKIVRRHLRD